MHFYYLCPLFCYKAGFFKEFAFSRLQRVFAKSATAFRNFPAVLIKRKTVLPYQPGIQIFIERYSACGYILKMNLTINAFSTRRIDHIEFNDLYPGILIDLLFIKDRPGIVLFIHMSKIKNPAKCGREEFSMICF